MNTATIPIFNIALAFLPFLIFIGVLYSLKMNWKDFFIAGLRMVLQLTAVGYLLTFLFNQNNFFWTALILAFMLFASGWIGLRSVKKYRKSLYKNALLGLTFGSLPILFWTVILVIPGANWSDPKFLIPLAGMMLANAMNTLGVAAERFDREIRKESPEDSQVIAFNASLIPHMNTLLALGIVSLPGLMTGQILSGVDPLIAVRYQIAVVFMILNSSTLTTAIYLYLTKRNISSTAAE